MRQRSNTDCAVKIPQNLGHSTSLSRYFRMDRHVVISILFLILAEERRLATASQCLIRVGGENALSRGTVTVKVLAAREHLHPMMTSVHTSPARAGRVHSCGPPKSAAVYEREQPNCEDPLSLWHSPTHFNPLHLSTRKRYRPTHSTDVFFLG